jgi:hypothetical protein
MQIQTQKVRKCHFKVGIRNRSGSNSRFKGYRFNQNDTGNTRVAIKKRKRSWLKIDMKSEVSPGKVLVDLPIRTISEANCFEPWQVKHGRHKEQKRIVALGLMPLKRHFALPCKIKLTRFAPDKLDAFDNLPMSFKYIVDAVCAIITGEERAGKADSDPRISITCDQVKSNAYGIRIEIKWGKELD